MKIRVIGSGNISSEYNSASYLVENDLLVDIPNGNCKALRRMGIDINDIKHILITHFHGDHYFDIPFYLIGRIKRDEDDKNIYIYTSKDGIKKIKKVLKLAFPNSIKKIYNNTNMNYITSTSFKYRNYLVEKVLVDHGNLKPAYGYIISKDDKKVGFTGDTCLCENVKYMANNCDCLFCDCALTIGNNKHMGINDIEKLSKEYKNCNFVVSHLSNKVRNDIQKMKIKNIIVPEDGMIIEV